MYRLSPTPAITSGSARVFRASKQAATRKFVSRYRATDIPRRILRNNARVPRASCIISAAVIPQWAMRRFRYHGKTVNRSKENHSANTRRKRIVEEGPCLSQSMDAPEFIEFTYSFRWSNVDRYGSWTLFNRMSLEWTKQSASNEQYIFALRQKRI